MGANRCFYGEVESRRKGKEAYMFLKWEKEIPDRNYEPLETLSRRYLHDELHLDQDTFAWTGTKTELQQVIGDAVDLEDGIIYGMILYNGQTE